MVTITINASLEAHRKIIHQRHEMEVEGGKVISTADALDVLLKEKEDERVENRKNDFD